METLNDVYKTGALLNAKKNSVSVQVIMQERREEIEKQVRNMYKISNADEEMLQRLIDGEIIKLNAEEPIINVTDTSKVKTLEEFINESIEKDRLVVVEIGESLQELIQTAPEEDVKYLQENEEEVQETYEIPEPDEIPEQEDKEEQLNNDEKDFIEPKYFVIQIGNEEEQKYIVIDKDGSEVGKIEDGQFEMNEEYFNSKLEQVENLDELIFAKVHNIQEVEKIKQELKPKTLEQLAEMNLDSGKEIVEKTEKIIEEPEKEIEPQEEEKGVKDEIDDEELKLEEGEEKETFEKLDELAKEDEKALEDYLDNNSSRKLIILIPNTLTDQLENHELKEKGEPITVYQLKGTVKPVFVLKQGERVLYGDRYNEQIGKNMARVPYSTGVVKEVSDEETKAQITLADGTEKEFLAKGEINDINQVQKAEVIAKLAELSAELSRITSITPDDMADYKIEFPGGPEQKCRRIDEIEMQMFQVCEQYGIVPPAEVKTKAVEETTPEEIEEKENDEKTPWDNYKNGRLRNDPNN